MAAITWRNVDGPDFRAANALMGNAQNTISNAFTGLQKELEKRDAGVDANWQREKEANTNAFLARLSEVQDIETAQSNMAALRQQMGSYGAAIDQNAARTALSSLVPDLQKKATASIQFAQAQQNEKDRLEALGQRDVVNGLAEALNRAETPDEVNRIKQAIGIYQNSNMLNASGGNDLTRSALTMGNTLEDRARAVEAHNSRIAADKASRAASAATQANARDGKVLQTLNALVSAIGREQDSVAGVTNNTLGVVKGLEDKLGVFDKESPFKGDRLTTKDDASMFKVGKDAGIDQGAVSDFLSKLREKYPSGSFKPAGSEVSVPISKGLVESAIAQSAGKWGFGFDGIKAKRIMDSFTNMVEAPGFVDEYQQYINGRTAFVEQIKAAKERGQADQDKVKDAYAPVMRLLNDRLEGVAPPKKK